MRENRRSERVETRLRCWCEGNQITFYARMGNLSEGGLFIRTATPLESGTRTTVRFHAGLPEEEVRAEATVMWSRSLSSSQPAGMGLRFDALNSNFLDAVRRIMHGEQQVRSIGG